MKKIIIVFSTAFIFLLSCKSIEEPIIHSITIEQNGLGTVSPRGIIDVINGEAVVISVIPSNDYLIDKIVIDDKEISSTNKIELTNVYSDHHIAIIFREIKTCLVLSVGGKYGLFHIGAINAIQEYEDIDYIFGNSMGSLIGALYASDPQSPLDSKYSEMMNLYTENTKNQVKDNALGGGLLGGLATLILSGGTLGWETVAGTLLGGYFSADSTDLIENERFTKTLDEYLGNIDISNFEIPYATQFIQQKDNGIEFITLTDGNAAYAVGNSINNPYIFKNTDLNRLDPGADRISAIPVVEAFKTFNPDRIIVVNVTNNEPIITQEVNCEIKIINISPIEIPDEAFYGGNEYFYNAVEYGYNQALITFD